MPNYQYICDRKHEYNEIRLISEDPKILLCPHCNGELRQRYFPPAISFKGPGFHRNDKS